MNDNFDLVNCKIIEGSIRVVNGCTWIITTLTDISESGANGAESLRVLLRHVNDQTMFTTRRDSHLTSRNQLIKVFFQFVLDTGDTLFFMDLWRTYYYQRL